MEKLQLRKNCLDLEYHGEAQKTNAYLILLTTGLLGFVGTFIWLKEQQAFYLGFLTTLIIFLMGIYLYYKSSRRMRTILEEIEQIE